MNGFSAGLGIAGTALNVANSVASWVGARKQRQHESYWNERNITMQKETNEMTQRENQLNRDFNAAEAQKQRDFEVEMMDKENAYNTPIAQMARYAEAGLNPGLQMQGQSAGIASGGSGSAASAPSPLGYQAPKSTFMSDMSGIPSQVFGEMLSSLKDLAVLPSMIQKNNAEAGYSSGLTEQLPTLTELYQAQKDKYKGDTNWFRFSEAYKNWAVQQGAVMAKTDLAAAEQNLKILNQQEKLMIQQEAKLLQDTKYQEIVNKYADKRQQAELDQFAATTYAAMAAGVESYATAKLRIQERLVAIARENGLKIQNDIAEKTAESYIEALNKAYEYDAAYNEAAKPFAWQNAMSDANAKYWHSKILQKDWKHYMEKEWIRAGGNVLGDALGAFGVIATKRKAGGRVPSPGAAQNTGTDYKDYPTSHYYY